MEMKEKEAKSSGIKFFIEIDGVEVGRAFLYLMHNDLHEEPFGLVEDVFVDEKCRGQGIGTKLVNKIIESAKEHNCYKLICTSRHSREKVHKLYKKIGFTNHGLEFRMNF
jgi:GNAT superfamily N-acetyltransferase